MPPEKSEKFDGKTQRESASIIMPKTITTSKGDNQFNPALLLTSLLFIVGVPGLWFYAVDRKINQSNDMYNARATARAQGTYIYTGVTALPTATKPGFMGSDGSVYLTATLQPTATRRPVTPTPTSTPAPTEPKIGAMKTYQGNSQKVVSPFQGEMWFMYSHYYPPLLGANCHPDNVIGDTCKDVTSSGEKWSDWLYGKPTNTAYRGGVAVSMNYPLGIVVEVSYPAALAGKYLAVDYCPACDTYPGVTFIDFLDENTDFPYWQPVKARFYYP